MNRKELKEHVKTLTKYVLFEYEFEFPNEVYCIWNKNGEWQAYYSERGQKTDLRTFQSEKEACNYVLEEIENAIKNMNL